MHSNDIPGQVLEEGVQAEQWEHKTTVQGPVVQGEALNNTENVRNLLSMVLATPGDWVQAGVTHPVGWVAEEDEWWPTDSLKEVSKHPNSYLKCCAKRLGALMKFSEQYATQKGLSEASQ